jgi:hypothetical protein
MKIDKKKMLPILIVVFVVLVIGNAIFKYVKYKMQEPTENTVVEDISKDEIDYDKLIEVETKEEYINGQKSNLDKWNKAFEKHKESITQDLWTNEKAQESFLKTGEEFINISKLVKNYTWLEGGNSTEILFIQAMDYFIDEVNLRAEIFELIKNNDPLVADKITKADEFNVRGMDLLLQAQNKFANLEKENN